MTRKLAWAVIVAGAVFAAAEPARAQVRFGYYGRGYYPHGYPAYSGFARPYANFWGPGYHGPWNLSRSYLPAYYPWYSGVMPATYGGYYYVPMASTAYANPTPAWSAPRTRLALYPALPSDGPQDPLPAAANAREAVSRIYVTLPAEDAEVWVEGVKTKTTGRQREYVTPALSTSHQYSYMIRARWQDASGARDEIRNVALRAGDDVRVDFSKK